MNCIVIQMHSLAGPKRMNKIICVLTLVLFIAGCGSSGPKTQYYSLFANKTTEVHEIRDKAISIGIGPIELPEYIDHPGIVSTTGSNRLIVSGYNAWAGDLKENISRVMASNLSAAFELDQVWAFPWNNRIKPDYRIRLVFEEYSGVKGGDIKVVVRWTLLNKTGKSRLLAEKESIVKTTQSNSYNDYVAALNSALDELSNSIAAKTAAQINPR